VNIEALRKAFVERVSWGPSKVPFGDAIAFFDQAAEAVGLVVPTTQVPDTAPTASDATTPRRKTRVEDSGMVLEDEQENGEALKKVGVKK